MRTDTASVDCGHDKAMRGICNDEPEKAAFDLASFRGELPPTIRVIVTAGRRLRRTFR